MRKNQNDIKIFAAVIAVCCIAITLKLLLQPKSGNLPQPEKEDAIKEAAMGEAVSVLSKQINVMEEEQDDRTVFVAAAMNTAIMMC